ncbi:methylglyoxal synthase [Teredinibacter waterburyi]|uniref:methylglyoxal synthase n=1 Tax=Teredinibacter waterburyi TaxID=1500538 RepID=UPI00165FE142|nr:methylglyoxal synthase [Teredinibacter waterburyi]
MKSKILESSPRKSIALIAHDNMKGDLGRWASKHKDRLAKHNLYATGTTGYKLETSTGLPITKCASGPLGGDQQIGAKISEGEIDMLIFFWDPFEPMPHDPDVKALLRIAAVWNIPVACNQASADFLITSSFFDTTYSRQVPDYESYIRERTV